MNRIRHSLPALIALAVCLVAFVAAARVSTVVFDRLPHVEDEVTFLFQAKTIASGHLMVPAPPRPEFFPIPFIIIQDGQWFGKYPPGYPAVLALGVLVGRPWLVNPLLGALSVGLVYLAGRRMYDESTALLAAGLLVTSPFFLLQAGSFMSHVVSLFWALASLYLFVVARQRGSSGMLVLVGVALGMLFLSRSLTAVGIGIPYVVWAAVDVLREPRRLPRYLAMLAGFLPFMVALLAYNHLTTGDPLRGAYELWWPCDKVGFGEEICFDGYSATEGIDNARFELGRLAVYLFGWPRGLSLVPAALAVAAALIVFIRRATRRAGRVRSIDGSGHAPVDHQAGAAGDAYDLLLAGMAAGLVLVHVAYWHGGPQSVEVYGPRYYFEAAGALALLSARGLVRVAELAAVLLRRRLLSLRKAQLWTRLAVAVATGTLVVSNVRDFAPQEFERFTRFYNVDDAGVQKVRAAGLRNAVVFVTSPQVPNYAWPDYAPFFCENDPSLDSDPLYVADLGDERNQVLMAQYPGRSFYRFADGQLTQLAPAK